MPAEGSEMTSTEQDDHAAITGGDTAVGPPTTSIFFSSHLGNSVPQGIDEVNYSLAFREQVEEKRQFFADWNNDTQTVSV